MEALKQVLIAHAKRYPLMQPADAVKLIYQNEFGGGHLIPDQQACLNYLCQEYEGVERDTDMPLTEDIGNGIVRVNLAAVKPEDLAPLGQDFIRSAAAHTGTAERFLQKLDILRQLTEEEYFGFGNTELEGYLSEYIASGCPMVSHSRIYRQQYAPAYRIVLSKLLTIR